jgi:hypothetical protein
MNQREKIINAIQDCRIGKPVDLQEMESLAKMYTDDLIDVLIVELHNLYEVANPRENLDSSWGI